MTDQKKVEKMLVHYYKTARKSIVDKMKSEEEERTKLKFNIAAFVIYELSHSTPPWFRGHFLLYAAKMSKPVMLNDGVSQVENTFYDVIAGYLIKLESEVDYVKNVLSSQSDEQDKTSFWSAIVFDAFLLVGIYFTPLLESGEIDHQARDMSIDGYSSPAHVPHLSTTVAVRR